MICPTNLLSDLRNYFRQKIYVRRVNLTAKLGLSMLALPGGKNGVRFHFTMGPQTRDGELTLLFLQ